MILTPLQLFGCITLIILASVSATILMISFVRHRLQTQIDNLHHYTRWSRQLSAKEFTETDQRVAALEGRDITINEPVVNPTDDVMDLWEAIVNAEKREPRL